MNNAYDLIGDIHGYADALHTLLDLLGYERGAGAYRHPEGRKVVFLGDYIDRGPKIRETLQTVRGMVEAGEAIALMGNHEFNALAYHTPDGDGGWLRPHTAEKAHQHAATMRQIGEPYPEEWSGWLDWFRGLPMSLDLPGLRAVHAAWDAESAELMRESGPLEEPLLRELVNKRSRLGRARDLLLNGPELSLPEGYFFTDKSGFSRKDIRLRWWEDPRGRTYREMVFPASETVPEHLIPEELVTGFAGYPADGVPVFVGHYWLPKDAEQAPVGPNIVCLDYSVAKGGPLVAYRWDGEAVIDRGKFVIGGRGEVVAG